MNYEKLKTLTMKSASKFKFGKRSLSNLAEVHPDLQKVFMRAIELTEIDMSIIDGKRTLAEQRINVANGASKTMNSRHLTGHAVDVVPYVNGRMSWHWPHYRIMRKAILQACEEVGVTLRAGANWDQDDDWEELGENDGPHWELPRRTHP